MTQTAAPSPDRILQLGLAFWGAKTLLSAVELGLFTELAAHGRRTRRRCAAPGPPSARRRATSSTRSSRSGMLDRRADGRYANTPETDPILDRAKPSYVGGLLEMANRRLYPFWSRLTEALRTGLPQNEAPTGVRLRSRRSTPTRSALEGFLAAMTGAEPADRPRDRGRVPVGQFPTFADVGCAQGALPVTVARAHPHLTGIGFDLAPVGPVFDGFVRGRARRPPRSRPATSSRTRCPRPTCW